MLGVHITFKMFSMFDSSLKTCLVDSCEKRTQIHVSFAFSFSFVIVSGASMFSRAFLLDDKLFQEGYRSRLEEFTQLKICISDKNWRIASKW